MAEHRCAELMMNALGRTVLLRKPGEELIHYSDRCSQYTSVAFGDRLRKMGLLPSIGSAGTAYDNAMAESFVATIELDLMHRLS